MDEAAVPARDLETEWWARYALTVTESSTYQAIFNKGVAIGEAKARAAMARRFLVIAGRRRLGIPASRIQNRIDETDSIELLDKMLENVLSVATWDDLLATE